MTLTINLSPAVIEKLQVQAAASGKDIETFVREAVEVKLAIAGKSFRDIVAPMHAEFDASGMSEKQLESLVDEALQDARESQNIRITAMKTAVFDCVVYVQAAISKDGPAAACLSLVEEGHVKLFITSAILAECRETLEQPKLRTRFRSLTDERVEAFLQRIGEIGELIADVPAGFSLPRDPDDAKYVDLAAATQATHIVSRDNDLLDLMKDTVFRNNYPNLTILAPTDFLDLVRKGLAAGQ